MGGARTERGEAKETADAAARVSAMAKPPKFRAMIESMEHYELPPAPADMSAEARAHWMEIRQLLAEHGHIWPIDLAILRGYCELLVRYSRLQAEYEQTGPLIEVRKPLPGRQGETFVERVVGNPVATQLRDVVIQVRVYARELGFTPASRGQKPSPPAGDGAGVDFGF